MQTKMQKQNIELMAITTQSTKWMQDQQARAGEIDKDSCGVTCKCCRSTVRICVLCRDKVPALTSPLLKIAGSAGLSSTCRQYTPHTRICPCSSHISMRAHLTAWLKTYESTFVSHPKKSLSHTHVSSITLRECLASHFFYLHEHNDLIFLYHTFDITLKYWNVAH